MWQSALHSQQTPGLNTLLQAASHSSTFVPPSARLHPFRASEAVCADPSSEDADAASRHASSSEKNSTFVVEVDVGVVSQMLLRTSHAFGSVTIRYGQSSCLPALLWKLWQPMWPGTPFMRPSWPKGSCLFPIPVSTSLSEHITLCGWMEGMGRGESTLEDETRHKKRRR